MSDQWLCNDCDKKMHAEVERRREIDRQEETRLKEPVDSNSMANKNTQSSTSTSAANRSTRVAVAKTTHTSNSTSICPPNNIITPAASQNMLTSKILVEPLLAYITFALQSAAEANIKRAVLGRFDHEEIVEAKTKLWSWCGEDKLGEFPRRKDSSSRSEREAHLTDIIHALIKLDNEDTMPTIVIDALSLGKIPRSHPEELNNISLADRLNQLESKMASMTQVLDTYVQENMAMRTEIEGLKAKHRTMPTVPTKTYAEMVRTPASTSEHVEPGRKRIPSKVSQQTLVVMEETDNTQVIAEEGNAGNLANTTNTDNSREQPGGREQNELNESQQEANGPHQEESGFQKQRHQRKKERQQEVRKEKRSRHQFLTGTGASYSGVRGAPEPVRYLFIKNIVKETSDSDVHNMIKEKGFLVQELKCISHPDAKCKSFKLSVPASQFDRLFDGNIWPAGVKIRVYRAPKN